MVLVGISVTHIQWCALFRYSDVPATFHSQPICRESSQREILCTDRPGHLSALKAQGTWLDGTTTHTHNMKTSRYKLLCHVTSKNVGLTFTMPGFRESRNVPFRTISMATLAYSFPQSLSTSSSWMSRNRTGCSFWRVDNCSVVLTLSTVVLQGEG